MEVDRPENETDRLWQEYSRVFDDWDDTTLARWMAQTLGQFAREIVPVKPQSATGDDLAGALAVD